MKTKSKQPGQSGAGLWLAEQPASPPATQEQRAAVVAEPPTGQATTQARQIAPITELLAEPPAGIEVSPEAWQLVRELITYGVIYDPAAPCPRCGCPLKYPLLLYPDTIVCCRCLPGGRIYGFHRSDLIYQLFPRTAWPLEAPNNAPRGW